MRGPSIQIRIETALAYEGPLPLHLLARRIHKSQGATQKVLLQMQVVRLVRHIKHTGRMGRNDVWYLTASHPWFIDPPFPNRSPVPRLASGGEGGDQDVVD